MRFIALDSLVLNSPKILDRPDLEKTVDDQEALQQNNAALLSLANSIRFGVGIVFFGTGLLLIAVGTILFAIAIWKSHVLPKWSGILLAVGFGLYIPQYVTPQIVRVLHGLLIMVACVWIGWNMSNRNMTPQDRSAVLRVAGQD